MIRPRHLAWVPLLVGLASSTCLAAPDRETFYQRTQPDGAISLTNVPDDNHGYQVMPVGTPATSSSEPATVAANGQAERTTDTVSPRLALTPPSIEARTGKLLDPDSAPTMAAAQARQSQEEIASAGGARERLLNLYQASRSAFENKRPPSQPQR